MRGLWIFALGLLLGAFLTWGLATAFEQAAQRPAECREC
jgi:hypothetical protein